MSLQLENYLQRVHNYVCTLITQVRDNQIYKWKCQAEMAWVARKVLFICLNETTKMQLKCYIML